MRGAEEMTTLRGRILAPLPLLAFTVVGLDFFCEALRCAVFDLPIGLPDDGVLTAGLGAAASDGSVAAGRS